MVKILSTGEIVADDDPRAGRQRDSGQARQGFGTVRHDDNQQGNEGQTVSVFEVMNQKLLGYGFPRFNVGPYTVEPIVSVGFILAGLLMGLPGLFIAAILFFVSKWSQSGGGPSSLFGGQQQGPGGQGRGGRGGFGSQGSGGYRLGNN